MPARTVLRYPHPALKTRCPEVAPGAKAERVAADLVDTMRVSPRCVGVAAPQIGELVRVVVVDVTDHPKATKAPRPARARQPGRRRRGGRRARPRGVPVDPGPDRQRAARDAGAGRSRRLPPATPFRSRRKGSRRGRSCTRSTTSTASCSSTASPPTRRSSRAAPDDAPPAEGAPERPRAAHWAGGSRGRAVGGAVRGRGARAPRLRLIPRSARGAAARRARPASAGRDRGARALCAPARRMGRGGARRAPDRHDRNRVREDARVQPAGARRTRARPAAPRALPLPDEGARAGSVPHARVLPHPAAAARDLRRRHPDGAPVADPANRERHPLEPRPRARRPAPEPRPLGRRAREPALRRSRRGARLPRRLRIARRERPAAAPADRAGSTAPSRSSCWRRPRSRTRESSRRASWACARRRSGTTARLAPSGRSSSGTRRSSTRSSASVRHRSRRRRSSRRSSSSAGSARSPSPSRARPPSSSTASRPSGSATTRSSRRTAPDTRRGSAARSSGG